ncbi:MAG: YceI family protein [Myxococcota bacterium]|nr:YceI family protein [Myxococcota bacterium]
MLIVSLLILNSGCITVECEPTEAADTEDSSIPTPSQDWGSGTENESTTPEETEEEEEEEPSTESEPTPEPTPEPVDYLFNDDASLLYVQVWKDEDAWGSGFAHNHVMRSSNWEGVVTYMEDDLSSCNFDFVVPVNDLIVDEDVMREYVGYSDTINQSDRAEIRSHMLDSNQLDAENHPYISFVSASCSLDSSAKLRVTGDFTLVGTTREVDLVMDFMIDGNMFYARGRFDFNHSDFNLTPYSALNGFIRNDEPLNIHFDMVGSAL